MSCKACEYFDDGKDKCSPKCGRYDKLILAIFLIALATLIIKL